ncbi:hypothetical protein [Cryobacterium sp. Hh11]|uniref:hypothetical protein n=1 Tax=Cryobacterium sp. Hh11 TaxID=2555868 RepID=UPI00141A81F9|nr:hypothetical protein [Cryobacterium sp. Hh11]
MTNGFWVEVGVAAKASVGAVAVSVLGALLWSVSVDALVAVGRAGASVCGL